MNEDRIRVLCVDDHPFVAEGLRARLAIEGDMEFVGRLASAEHLVPEVEKAKADIVLLDIEMPGPDPFGAVEDLCRRLPNVKAILLSAYVRDHYIDSAVRAGCWGYLSKSDDPEEIIAGIRKVAGGEFAFGPEVLRRCEPQETANGNGVEKPTPPASRLERLTAREQEVLRMIGKGMSRAQIASSLFRSPKTVDAHRISIMEKLDIHDRVELARYAIREGLVEV
jgi:two-component system response regulator NreC